MGGIWIVVLLWVRRGRRRDLKGHSSMRMHGRIAVRAMATSCALLLGAVDGRAKSFGRR